MYLFQVLRPDQFTINTPLLKIVVIKGLEDYIEINNYGCIPFCFPENSLCVSVSSSYYS